MKKRKISGKTSVDTLAKRSFLLKNKYEERKNSKQFTVSKSSFNAWVMWQVDCFEKQACQRKLSSLEKKQLVIQARSLYFFFKHFSLSLSFLQDACQRACKKLSKNRQLTAEFCYLMMELELVSSSDLYQICFDRINQHALRCKKESSFLQKSFAYFSFLFLHPFSD
ncbi:MAG: hypothetical protein GWP59_06630 [Chlamydiales bacterium]|nr:hypothetical protein [Chlamydiales bacterium]NCF71357.1 hypothetical protein [Chlamydiales bacterium]